MAETKELTGPDLARGISLSKLADGNMLEGSAKGKPIIVARRGDGYFAIGAMCTHYGAPLATGIIVDDTVRCPWHHACFSLRTGEAGSHSKERERHWPARNHQHSRLHPAELLRVGAAHDSYHRARPVQ